MLLIDDLSFGAEKISIPVTINSYTKKQQINDIFSNFKYISCINEIESNQQYLQYYSEFVCKCIDGCFPNICSCNVYDNYWKNNSTLINTSYPIIECSSLCKCNWYDCNNRIIQKGINIPLEIYDTTSGLDINSKGWGVRSSLPIPKGTFICEYIGKIEYHIFQQDIILKSNESNRRMNACNYILSVNEIYSDNDNNHHSNQPFSIDASYYGNIARFINHSCSPNISMHVCWRSGYPLLKSVAFFSNQHIDSGQELTVDYGSTYSVATINTLRIPCLCESKICKKYLPFQNI